MALERISELERPLHTAALGGVDDHTKPILFRGSGGSGLDSDPCGLINRGDFGRDQAPGSSRFLETGETQLVRILADYVARA